MTKLPSIKPKQIVKLALKLGFVLDRQKGSHAIYYHAQDKRRAVIPMHNKDLKPGTLRGIIGDLGLTADEFLQKLPLL